MMMIRQEMSDILNMSGSSSNSNSSSSSFGIQRFDDTDVHNLDSQDNHEQQSGLSLDQSDSQSERKFRIQGHKRQKTQHQLAQQQQAINQQLSLQQQIQQQQLQQQHQLNNQQQQQQQQQNLNNQQQNQDNKPKRNPYCSRCRNHGKSAQVKGHKRHCEYRECQCEGCKLVECRQIVSAAQIKRRRYQKQDEECGRQIEISPPVLRREPNNDPAALIAKTLIGSAAGKHLQQQQQVVMGSGSQKLVTPSGHHQHHQLMPHLSIHQSASAATLVAANLASSSATVPVSSHHPHGISGGSSNVSNNHQPHHLHGARLNLTNAQSPHRAPASAALSNALHLFQLPNSIFSAPATLTAGQSSSTMPGFREQIALVEEIYQAHGPLAIFAWLRAEHFDLQKVRDLIEVSRVSFDEILQIVGHSPLDLTSPIVD